MEYQVRTDRSIDRDKITVAILHWLRNTHPVARAAQAGAAVGGLATFGQSTQPGRLGGSFGSPARTGVVPARPQAGRVAAPGYPVVSPGHNIHSPHQMQVTGETTIAPHLFIRQTRTTGGMHHHLFLLGDHSVLTVQQQGYHYRWGQPGHNWHKPLVVAHPPALLPADLTASLVQQALQHNASAVSQMSPWQKLLWAAMEGCRTVNLGGAIWEDVIKPMLNWESAAILLGIVVLCAIPYVGEVVLVVLMGAAIYDLITRVAGLFKQYYEAAVAAKSYEGLQQAAKFFSSAVVGGLLDLLGLLAGGSALARIRLLRAQGRLTVSAWLEAMAEWGQQLMRRLRSDGRMLDKLINGQRNQPPATSQAGTTARWRQTPNSTYTHTSPTGKTSYTYHTDQHGRITSAEGGLALDKAPRNKYEQANVGRGDGRVDGDAGGHLIGSQFGGAGTSDNMTAMNHAKVNAYPNGEYGRLEKRWANELAKTPPSKVEVKIEAIYDASNTTSRPNRYKVTERINGKRSVYKIENP